MDGRYLTWRKDEEAKKLLAKEKFTPREKEILQKFYALSDEHSEEATGWVIQLTGYRMNTTSEAVWDILSRVGDE